MALKTKKTCLLISYGPVPTPQYQTIEGGGMRVWGLAKGLEEHGIDVTVGINQSFPQDKKSHDNVKLVNWSLDDDFRTLINSFDSVIVSYTMGDPAVFIADNLNDNVQLILDGYVPIYVEVSARNAEDMDSEFQNYMPDKHRWNHVLRRGDYLLCANEQQKTFYTGVLSALGIINPHSYKDSRVLVVPFGVHDAPIKATENPYRKLGISEDDFVVLWFGGLYPWFRTEELLKALLQLSEHKFIKFVFVGGQNPFNPNPDFAKQYKKAVEFCKKQNLTNRSVFFVDWVDFNQRVNWYVHADTVISINQPGEENKYSWRTRVMDFVWGELAIITNGGDPLSDELIRENAAIHLPQLSAEKIASTIIAAHDNPKHLTEVKQSIKTIKKQYFWSEITKIPLELIKQGRLPFTDEFAYRQKLGISDSQEDLSAELEAPKSSKITRAAQLPFKVVRHARKKGIVRTLKLSGGIARTQVRKRKVTSSQKRYVFISHPLNNTGAPIVLIQIIEEFAKKYGGRNITLVAPSILPHQLAVMKRLGVRVDKAAFGLGFRLIRMQLGLRKDDFVLMNTVAIYDNYRDFIMLWLRTGRLRHAYWFVHEDQAQIPIIHPEFLEKKNIAQTSELIGQGKLSLMVPSQRTKEEYNELLGIKDVKVMNLRVDVDDKYKHSRPEAEYSALNFLLSGTAADGRKAQFLAISAFSYFYQQFYKKNPSNYRNFILSLVAIDDDYISQQIKWTAHSLLGKHAKIYPSLPKDQALGVTEKCNAVICCSLNETFGLYVAEGMQMGHIVLRNNSAGVDEQLKDGVNGYFVDHTDILQFAAVIEKLLNKKTSSNKQLQDMGKASQTMMAIYSKNSYIDQI